MIQVDNAIIAAFTRSFFLEQLSRARDQRIAEGWSVQGFGMLRYHLSDEFRINVWDRRYRVSGVSDIHTHPWNFASRVLLGTFRNIRYHRVEPCEAALTLNETRITPGDKGGALTPVGRALLLGGSVETYSAGDTYHQVAEEIHRSVPDAYAVTINQRVRVGADEASVFHAGDWVPAKPRPATPAEVYGTLSMLFAAHPELHRG